ncbi:MAG: tRNA adenosine(34) deaminase TadA [Gammaproteobacteria bacterium]|nr:MAG: tRNA adenosine(34) deaminase TadA [Gammaproteobacteria bacterium]
MRLAMEQAHRAADAGEVPVGAVLVLDDRLVGSGCNSPITLSDPSAHAEIMALRAAGEALNNYRFPGSVLYVTLEPCPMCASALVHARVQRIVYGAADPRTGACGSVIDLAAADFANHRIEVSGPVMAESGDLLREFFRSRR